MRYGIVPRTAVDVLFAHIKDVQVFTGALEDARSMHDSMHLIALVAEEKHRPAVFPSQTSTVATSHTDHTPHLRDLLQQVPQSGLDPLCAGEGDKTVDDSC